MSAHYVARSWSTIFGDIWFSHIFTRQLQQSFGREELMAAWYFLQQSCFHSRLGLVDLIGQNMQAQWNHVLPQRLLLKSLPKYITNGVGSQVLGHFWISAVDPWPFSTSNQAIQAKETQDRSAHCVVVKFI